MASDQAVGGERAAVSPRQETQGLGKCHRVKKGNDKGTIGFDRQEKEITNEQHSYASNYLDCRGSGTRDVADAPPQS